MPIENEFKHVLHDPDGRLLELLLDSHPWLELEQFYVGNGQARFRRIVDATGSTRFVFTYKQPVADRLLEIETDVDMADFELAKTVAISGVRKTRFQISDGTTHWDIDFLYALGDDTPSLQAHFAMAEAELADGVTEHSMLEILEPFILYSVPKAESVEFTNERLGNPDYAGRMMRSLRHRYARIDPEG